MAKEANAVICQPIIPEIKPMQAPMGVLLAIAAKQTGSATINSKMRLGSHSAAEVD